MFVAIRGWSGSGKSTLAKSLGVPVYEADDYFTDKNGNYNFDAQLLPWAHEHCFRRFRAAMLAGKECVVSNTFTRVSELQPYIDLCNQLGVEYTVVRCHGNFPNTHGVPEDKVLLQKERMEDFPGEQHCFNK